MGKAKAARAAKAAEADLIRAWLGRLAAEADERRDVARAAVLREVAAGVEAAAYWPGDLAIGVGTEVVDATRFAPPARTRRWWCVACKQLRGDVTRGPCPYAEDIHGDKTPVALCPECRRERAADI